VVIADDGAFFMHGMELHTALQYLLPAVTFVLFDNHAYAICVTREQLFYGDHYSYNRFGPSRLGAGLAATFPGLAAVDAADPRQLGVVMKAAPDVDGPSVVSIECAADETPPFAAFLDTSTAKSAVNNHFKHRGEPRQCRHPRLRTSLPIAAPRIRLRD
jgi:acetolactate synthase-1/2/3 large subunit